MLMTPEEIKSELVQLDERIVSAGSPDRYIDVLQLRQAKQRHEMLQAELRSRSNQQKEI